MFHVDLPIDTQVTSELIAYFIGNTYAKYYKIRQCFLELRLKMSGIFLRRTVLY